MYDVVELFFDEFVVLYFVNFFFVLMYGIFVFKISVGGFIVIVGIFDEVEIEEDLVCWF